MYPSFIKKAQEEGNNKAVQVFTRAKLAEAYHAKLYMDAYTTIDTPFDGKYVPVPHLRLHPQGRKLHRLSHLPGSEVVFHRLLGHYPTFLCRKRPRVRLAGAFPPFSQVRMERFPTFAPVRRPRTSRRPLRANLSPVWCRCVPVCRLRASRLSAVCAKQVFHVKHLS